MSSQGFSNSTIDAAAHRISMRQTVAEVRDYLLDLGLSEYNAYLCFKAASLLLAKGFYSS
jgi:hypothetical protein